MKRHSFFHLLWLTLTAALLTACHHARIPDNCTDAHKLPALYPDYNGVTIPVNIAPLTFGWDGACDELVARFATDGTELVCGGQALQPDADEWRRLTAAAAGKAVTVEVYARKGDNWQRYDTFSFNVSPDSIDPYISYRLISPSYVTYEDLTLNQRCLEDYREQVMVNNMLCATETNGQCVNCHNYQNYNPERMQFHARHNHGGTVVKYDGRISKINMRNDSLLSAGVYPAWHPWLPLIVYSTNLTSQTFHTRHSNKIEVFDAGSDLIAFDLKRNEVTNIENDAEEFEVFPCWAPDGRSVYYCSAHYEFRDTTDHATEVIRHAKEIKYNIYRKSFDPDTYTFGPRQLVYRADSLGQSATLPRVSPDGRYLMFTLGHYGVFHIWHHEADLYLMDLADGRVRPMDELNSADTESYHSWSSNGRWVIFSSRRNDGGFTRLFIAHVDPSGRGSKPFELPQATPDFHRQFMKSYNIPEFMKGPVSTSPQEFADVLKSTDGTPVKYVSRMKP